MKFLIATIFSLFASLTYAHTEEWKLTEIQDTAKRTVGFIYHVESTGVNKTQKDQAITGLRFVCTTTEPLEPIIAVYWHGLRGGGLQYIKVKVDGEIVPNSSDWLQFDELITRSSEDSSDLIYHMINGRKIEFEWTDSETRNQLSTSFTLDNFVRNLIVFEKICSL